MMPHRHTGPLLVVEDGDEDFAIFTHALKQASVANGVIRCRDGDELERITDDTTNAGKIHPALMVLDLNLPGSDGRDILRELRREGPFTRLPIIVLSTSNNPRDIDLCYARGASAYAVKPVDLGGLERLVRVLADFWLECVELPPHLT